MFIYYKININNDYYYIHGCGRYVLTKVYSEMVTLSHNDIIKFIEVEYY